MSSEFRSEEMEARAFREEIPYPAPHPGPAREKVASFAGLDMGSYPGAQAMEAYKGAGFAVTCVYLANKPGRIQGGENSGWVNAAAGLAAKGWGCAPTYLGAQASLGGSWTPTDPLHEAPIDGAEAVKLALKAGLEKGQTIFLDVEAPFSAGSAQESYVLKWIETVKAQGFNTALYCFPHQIPWVQAQGLKIWTVHLNSHTGTKDKTTKKITWSVLTAPLPEDPIDTGAVGTQGRFFCHAAGRTDEIDYDRWTVPDPSRM